MSKELATKEAVTNKIADYLKRPDIVNEIKNALPAHLTPERLARVCLTNIRTTPALMECTVPSLLAAVMQSAALGLEPGILGHCYFVPFKRNAGTKQDPQWVKDVQFIIGYKGLLALARRTGDIKSIGAAAIYSNDKFIYRKGFEETLEHEPKIGDRGSLAGFYAYGLTKDGGRYADMMSVEEVKKIMQRSKAKDFGPWVTDFEEMGRKTVLRRLCKYLPMSVEEATQIRDDEEREFGEISMNAEEETEKAQTIADEIRAKRTQRIEAAPAAPAQEEMETGKAFTHLPVVEPEAAPPPKETKAAPKVATKPEAAKELRGPLTGAFDDAMAAKQAKEKPKLQEVKAAPMREPGDDSMPNFDLDEAELLES